MRVVKSVDVAAAMPPEAAKAVTRIIGLNMTYDGHIAAAAPGALVVLDRDLNVKSYVTFSGEAVDNSIAIDEHNGIYVVTSRRMLKVVWNGTEALDRREGRRLGVRLRMDPGRGGAGRGLDLARLGHDTDADGLRQRPGQARRDRGCRRGGTNLVAFWRDEIPADFQQKPGTKSRRIADQARIEISQLTIEPSPNVLGYGVAVINGSYPQPVKTPGLPERLYRRRDAAGAARRPEVRLEPAEPPSTRRGSTARSTTPTSWCRWSRRRPACSTARTRTTATTSTSASTG